MARVAHFNGVSETIHTNPQIFLFAKKQKRSSLRFACHRTEEIADCENEEQKQKERYHCIQISRRTAAIGFSAVILSAKISEKATIAEEGNGFFIEGPLPVPSVTNKIANEATGTRSFLKKGIYIANVGSKGSAYRIRQYAFDLLALGDLIGQDAWNYVRKYLRLKSTVMYYDFDKVISAAIGEEDKQALTTLANRLFDNVEKLEDAVKLRNLVDTKTCYEDTTAILQEVMSRMT